MGSSEGHVQTVEIEIPGMQWTTWVAMVSLALDESAGILDYDVNLALSTATVTFDDSAVALPTILTAITQRTGYDNLTVEWPA